MPFQSVPYTITNQSAINGRPETESITTYLASLISSAFTLKLSQRAKGTDESQWVADQKPLRILDLCTGTGCIPLLMHAILSPRIQNLRIAGADISPISVSLANENLKHNIKGGSLQEKANEQLSFYHADVFSDDHSAGRANHTAWDILVSNPPYISPSAFNKTTSRSVRNYEPKEALVPPQNLLETAGEESIRDTDTGDAFYPRLLHIAQQVHAKVLLMEVADIAQATRVVELVIGTRRWEACQIWRDWSGARKEKRKRKREVILINGTITRVMGEGNGRAVLAWRDGGGKMLGLSERCR